MSSESAVRLARDETESQRHFDEAAPEGRVAVATPSCAPKRECPLPKMGTAHPLIKTATRRLLKPIIKPQVTNTVADGFRLQALRDSSFLCLSSFVPSHLLVFVY